MLPNLRTKGKQLFFSKAFWGVGISLLLFGGMMLFAAPAAAQTVDNGFTSADIDSLLYMREEEKLAHDVYVTLYDLWGVPLFSNIANSEQVHTEMVLSLLNQYELFDPAAGNAVGVFTNEALQTLYDSLVGQGSQSYADALLVGGLIEEVDIADLQAELNTTNVLDIQQLYQSLLNASSNHLAAFVAQYENVTGAAYVPQHLSEAEVTAVLGSNTTPGNGNRGGVRGAGNSWSGGNGNGNNGQANGNNSQGGNGQMNRLNGRSQQNGAGGGSGICRNDMM